MLLVVRPGAPSSFFAPTATKECKRGQDLGNRLRSGWGPEISGRLGKCCRYTENISFMMVPVTQIAPCMVRN